MVIIWRHDGHCSDDGSGPTATAYTSRCRRADMGKPSARLAYDVWLLTLTGNNAYAARRSAGSGRSLWAAGATFLVDGRHPHSTAAAAGLECSHRVRRTRAAAEHSGRFCRPLSSGTEEGQRMVLESATRMKIALVCV